MKKIFISIVTIAVAIVAFATTKVWIYEKNGNRTSFEYGQLDSITHITPGTIALSVSEKKIPYRGGTFDVDVIASQPWTAAVSNPDMVQISQQSGNGNSTVKVTVNTNRLYEPITANIKFRIADGTVNTLLINIARWQDKISVTPEDIILTPKDNSFLVDVTCNTSWTASCNVEWLILSEYSGSGNGSVNVEVQVNPTLVQDNFATLTFKTIDEKIWWCYVYRKGDKVSVNPATITLPPAGGTYKIGITSNTDWTISASESWVSFDKTQGTLNDSVEVIVAKSDKVESTSATITITTPNGKTATCTVIHEGDKVSVSPTIKEIRFEGGTIDVSVTSNTEWTASSNKSWASVSIEQGTGDALFVINVASGVDKAKADTAIVTCTTTLGKSAAVTIYRAGYTGKGDNVTDIQGRSYPTVWIGGQNWMAENYRCSKYDTQSEAYNATWLTNNTIPTTSEDYTYTPYYTDASDKSKWSSDSQEYGVNLTDAQIEKLGYRYNWAAAVGVADGIEQTTAFSGKRQGICPNGWHLPSRAECQTLQDYIERTDGKGTYTAGKHLKTTSGWYNDGNGTDTYGFAALPAGYTTGSAVFLVGDYTGFWTATPAEIRQYAYVWAFNYISDHLIEDTFLVKYSGPSVRCLKD